MTYLVLNNQGEASRMQRIAMLLLGLPKTGRHVGTGRHVPMPTTPANPDAARITGWTTRHVDFVAHPVDSRLAIRVTDELREAITNNVDVLPVGLRNWIQSRIGGETTLGDDWKSDDGDGSLAIRETENPDPE